MTSARQRLSRVILATAVAALVAPPALAGPAYLKLGGVEGDSGETAASSDKPRVAVIEVHSFAFGVEREMKESGEKGGTEDINIGVGELQEGARANDRLRTAGPKDGWPSAQAGEAEITLKGAAGTGAAAAKPHRPSNITLKRGTSSAAAGGVQVAVGDVTGDGAAAGSGPVFLNRNRQKELLTTKREGAGAGTSGLATGKRQHKPFTFVRPPDQGSVTLVLKSAWDGCRVGARYPELELGGDGKVYKLKGAVVTGCAASGGDRPTESVSLNYTKIEF